MYWPFRVKTLHAMMFIELMIKKKPMYSVSSGSGIKTVYLSAVIISFAYICFQKKLIPTVSTGIFCISFKIFKLFTGRYTNINWIYSCKIKLFVENII